MRGNLNEFIIHPGETLKEVLDIHHMSQKELAIRTNVSEPHISKILRGEKAISVRMAKSLEYVFGIESAFWINLQALYDEELEAYREINAISETEFTLLKKLAPVITYLEDQSIIDKYLDNVSKVISLRSFLRVRDLNSLPDILDIGAYRLGSKGDFDPHLLYAWLMVSKDILSRQELSETYNELKLRESIPLIRNLMRAEFPSFLEGLKTILASCGIKFAYTNYYKGAPVQGYVRNNRDNTYDLIVTDRQKRGDIFWFSLFHELAHILNKDVTTMLVDFASPSESTSNKAEIRADKLATDLLIPEKPYQEFIQRDNFHIEKIREFAASVEVPPFIVIGRLQKEGLVSHSAYSQERVNYNLGLIA